MTLFMKKLWNDDRRRDEKKKKPWRRYTQKEMMIDLEIKKNLGEDMPKTISVSVKKVEKD